MEKVLEGIKVIDFTTYAAAPGMGRALGDWGAEVIKVEGPGGDPYRAWGYSMGMPIDDDENPLWTMVNGNKKGIVINMKSEEGKKVMYDLLKDADIFMSNTRIGALKKLGLDYETLAPMFPKLVWAHMGGFGNNGPDAPRPGYDITSFWSHSGSLVDVVAPDADPINPPPAFADNCANFALGSGMLAALVKQKMTGKGSKVETSLYGLSVWASSFLSVSTQYGEEYPRYRWENLTPMIATYRCSDGEWLQFTLPAWDVSYPKLCRAIGLDEYAEDERFTTVDAMKLNQKMLFDLITEAMLKKDSKTWSEVLTKADLAFALVRHWKDIPEDEQAFANGYTTKFTFDSGHTATLCCPPITFGDPTPAPLKAGPKLGEHTDELLKGLGYSDERIAELRASKAII